MKIIFSRKGFDSSYGGVASPIYHGQVISLPIPEPWPGCKQPAVNHRPYASIRTQAAAPTGDLVDHLAGSKVTSQTLAHLDPDLDPTSLARPAGWRPVFGQTGAAERHLQNQGVGPGDVFLFFGWFRQVVRPGSRFQFLRDAPDLHVCFGWLQIEQRLPVLPNSSLPGWTVGHPHHKPQPYNRLDSIYTSTPTLLLNGQSVPGPNGPLPGAGVLDVWHPKRCLTASRHSRVYWKLPSWFYPPSPEVALTYHRKPSRWRRVHGGVVLKTVCQGQEFVFDCQSYSQAIPWLMRLLT